VGHCSGNNVSDCLRLAGARRPLQHETATSQCSVDGGDLRRISLDYQGQISGAEIIKILQPQIRDGIWERIAACRGDVPHCLAAQHLIAVVL
jgi:hypothetical protein